MTSWLECSTRAEAEAVDAVAELFGRLGQGVAIEEPVVSSPDGEQVSMDSERPVLVKTYLPLDSRSEERRRQLEEGVWHLGRLRRVEALQVCTLEESDWADAWKKHFFVHRVGSRIVVVPSWRRYGAQPGDIAIQLDPSMAFGTGLHPTTRLCLAGLETHLSGGERVLDLGTGSGILAIAAARLGARRVLGLDVEEIAARVATENVERNALSGVVEIRHGSLPLMPWPGECFDLVVANISRRVLTELHQDIREVLRPGGLALLSGVLEGDVSQLLEAMGVRSPDLGSTLPDDPHGVESHSDTSPAEPGRGAPTWRLLEQRHEAEWSLLVCAAEGQ